MLGGLDFHSLAAAVRRALQPVIGTIGGNGTILLADASQAAGARWAPKAFTPGGRLTVVSGAPVSSDVTGAATIYYTPDTHDVIELFDGSAFIPRKFSELSQALNDATKSPAAAAANQNFDYFLWDDNNTLRCTRGPAWAADAARGTGAGSTELEVLEGRRVNKFDITNGPAARRGLYVGSIRSNGSSSTDDFGGNTTLRAKRNVYNFFNQRPRFFRKPIATDSWTYTTGTIRAADNDAENRVEMMRGLDEDAVHAACSLFFSQSIAGVTVTVGFGLDSTSSFTGERGRSSSVANGEAQCVGFYHGQVGLGFHFLSMNELPGAAGVATLYGDSGAPANYQSGLSGMVFA